MELAITHTVSRPIARVEAALLDPAFVERLADGCAALSAGRLLGYEARGETVERAAWFCAAPGSLDGAFALLPRVSWVERVRWSRVERSGRVEVIPEVPPVMARRVVCSGIYTLAAQGDGSTLRSVAIGLEVRAPLVRSAVEARLAAMLGAVFEAEAALLGAGT